MPCNNEVSAAKFVLRSRTGSQLFFCCISSSMYRRSFSLPKLSRFCCASRKDTNVLLKQNNLISLVLSQSLSPNLGMSHLVGHLPSMADMPNSISESVSWLHCCILFQTHTRLKEQLHDGIIPFPIT